MATTDGLQLVWEAPLESIFDVAAVSMASCCAIRLGLHSPAALAEAQSSKASLTNQRRSHSAHPATVYHPGIQLELWFYGLLEHMVSGRISRVHSTSLLALMCLLIDLVVSQNTDASTHR